MTTCATVLKELMDVLRKEAPGTNLNNHRFDSLGLRAHEALKDAEQEADQVAKLRDALEGLLIQALQSNVNSAASEWGIEAITKARVALGGRWSADL